MKLLIYISIVSSILWSWSIFAADASSEMAPHFHVVAFNLPRGYTELRIAAFNNNGTIIGKARNQSFGKSFVYKNDKFVLLPSTSQWGPAITSISDSGYVVGYDAIPAQSMSLYAFPWIWDGKTQHLIEPKLPYKQPVIEPIYVSNTGKVLLYTHESAGTDVYANPRRVSWIWDGSNVRRLSDGPPIKIDHEDNVYFETSTDSYHTPARYDVNMLDNDGSRYRLFNGQCFNVSDNNNWIVGWVMSDKLHFILFHNGKISNLPFLGVSVNSSGWVVGNTCINDYYFDQYGNPLCDVPPSTRAVIEKGNRVYDLMSVTSGIPKDYTLVNAIEINDKNWILALAYYRGRETSDPQTFILKPG